MTQNNSLEFVATVLAHMPSDWLNLTTHRLDIYNENLAKTEFLEHLEDLYQNQKADMASLAALPTAYDYIRLGHPLSSLLEWTVAKLHDIPAERVISFSSTTMPILAVLRTNLFQNRLTRICYKKTLSEHFDASTVRDVYGYNFKLESIETLDTLSSFEGTTIFIDQNTELSPYILHEHVDIYINTSPMLGSVLLINGSANDHYISDIQHVRRRETIAMTPANCHRALHEILGQPAKPQNSTTDTYKNQVVETVQQITATSSKVLLASSGLSMQYALMMGLIDDAMRSYPNQPIKIIVPPNCYGGTNDQARRVAACIPNVTILDLPVDRDNDMAKSTDRVLEEVAKDNAVPLIIAEIPTNPRVEVPDLKQLEAALSKTRHTPAGAVAIKPFFILDQTFCPNVQFCGEAGILANVKIISYVSGSKFPSGGRCTAGYAVSNQKAAALLAPVEKHLKICDNEATALQVAILAEQLPTMNKRIMEAYKNTKAFVDHIKTELPEAKINFVTDDLARQGFTPSVFSLDLPTKGNNAEAREAYKRQLNKKLIDMMITQIPNESKHCVSYGQLKGCYWTIPATSTQGTTKEADKDYIARVSVSPDLDLEKHKAVFSAFVADLKNA